MNGNLINKPLYLKSILNKKHNKKCQNTKNINYTEKIIKVLSLLAELAKFSGEDPDCWHKQNDQECEELDPHKNLIEPAFSESRKIDYNHQYQQINKVAAFQKKSGDGATLVQALRFQISERNRKNYNYKYPAKNIVENFRKI